MNNNTKINLLLSIRSQIDALLEDLTQQPEEPKQCTHPADYRLNMSVLGSNIKKYKCKLCDYEWEEGVS